MTTPAQAPEHVELDTATGLVYALLEDWTWPGSEKSSKVLALQAAAGGVGQRFALNSTDVARLVKRHPELEPLVQAGLIADPQPAAPPTVAELSAQVQELTRLLLEQRAASTPATPVPAPPPPPGAPLA